MKRKQLTWLAVLVAVALVEGGLVWGAFGRNHVKTVTEQKVVTQTVTKRLQPPPFNGSLPALVAFLHPQSGKRVTCSKSFPAHSACFQLGSAKWFIFFAAPESAAS